MKCTLVMVTSVNGKMTRGMSPNIYTWTSKEDSDYFFSLIEKHNLIIMGRKTYETNRQRIRLVLGKLRVVLTGKPKHYAHQAVRGQLEFTSETPKELVRRLTKAGHKEALVVGGSEVAAAFLHAGLIGRLELTIEPYIFGKGLSFVGSSDVIARLRLVSIKRLNKRGTMVLSYRVGR